MNVQPSLNPPFSVNLDTQKRCIRLGSEVLPLYSGAVHYWRLDPTDWRACLLAIVDLGCGLVETYVPWSVHEQAHGRYDFGTHERRHDLRRFLTLAHELGLRVILRPGPHINAELTFFGLPERVVFDSACQARSKHGDPVLLPVPPRMFPVPSYASRALMREVDGWFQAVAHEVADLEWPAGPIVLIQVDNEASFYFRDGAFDQDYHPDALLQWETYLRRRYGSIKELSGAYEQLYTKWSDVGAPVSIGTYGHPSLVDLRRGYDWVCFQESLLTGALSQMKKSLIDAGFERSVTMHNLPLGEMGSPLHLPQVERVVDLVGLDFYHHRQSYPVVRRRSLYAAGTSRFPYVPELGVGGPPWFSPFSQRDSLFTALTAFAYGIRGFNLYMAVDRDRWVGALSDLWGNLRPAAAPWKKLLDAFARTGFHQLERKASIGLVVPRCAQRFARLLHPGAMLSPTALDAADGDPFAWVPTDTTHAGQPAAWWYQLEAVTQALSEKGIQHVWIDSESNPCQWLGLETIVLPTSHIMSKSLWEHLQVQGASGKQVLLVGEKPVMDERLMPTVFDLSEGMSWLEGTDALVSKLVDLQPTFASQWHAEVSESCEVTVHDDGSRPRLIFVMHPAQGHVETQLRMPGHWKLRDVFSDFLYEGHDTLHLAMSDFECRVFEVEAFSHV